MMSLTLNPLPGSQQQGRLQSDRGRDSREDRRSPCRRWRPPRPHPGRRPGPGRGDSGRQQGGALPADTHCQDRPEGK